MTLEAVSAYDSAEAQDWLDAQADEPRKRWTDVAYLRSLGVQPHFFGLGFIQLKLDDSTRMHFWHPDLRPITGEEEVHDHRYDFDSTVLKGELAHEVWMFAKHDLGDHELVSVSCQPGGEEKPILESYGVAFPTGTYFLAEGSRYHFPANCFHRTLATTRAVTFLTRGKVKKQMASVVRPRGAPHVCPFSKTIPADELWERITEMLA